jgi:putative membrane protein
MMYGFRGGYGYGMHALPWLSWVAPVAMIVFWAAVVTGIIFLIRYLVLQSRSPLHESTALSILKERYAKGDITKEEFEQKRKDLA